MGMKKYCSYKREKSTTADNELNREFRAEKPNQKWVTDVTEFRLFGQKLNLSPILDLWSRDIVKCPEGDSPVMGGECGASAGGRTVPAEDAGVL